MSGNPTQFPIDLVETALVDLLQRSLPGAYGQSVQVDSLGSKDFNEDGTLALRPPAIRVQFEETQYNTLGDNTRLNYEAWEIFNVLCFQSSLRSKADERKQSLQLVKATVNQLAGARLALADGGQSMPIELRGVRLMVVEDLPVDQFYLIQIAIRGIAQFLGPNSIPGGAA